MFTQSSTRAHTTARPATPLTANHVLASLPEEDYRRIAPALRRVVLRSRQTLVRQGQPVQEIIFPSIGVCSLIKNTQDGHSIEVLGIGLDGVVGATVALGQPDSPTDVVVQMSDDNALSLPVDVLKQDMQLGGALASVVVTYCRVLTIQLMQASACHARHSVEQRCCRWLLATQARVQTQSFGMTQEMLAMALGVRRPTVTLIIADLQRVGAVQYSRGHANILDEAALVERACACIAVQAPRLYR
jgi:CRP-like cAMP-binding protein